MITVNARIAARHDTPFESGTIERRDVGPHDVLIDIAYAGICHTDVAHSRSEAGPAPFPIVPGHEIAGVVAAAGSQVTRFAVGDRVGVGCIVGSCGTCANCRSGDEHHCADQILTYGALDHDGTITQGGYSQRIVVDENFTLRIPDGLELAGAAPLLCAGITTYSPLRRWHAGSGSRVAIVGMGGLGHVGLQIAAALGAHTTMLDRSLARMDDGLRMGADAFRSTADPLTFDELEGSFDLILSTVPARLDFDAFLRLLALNGTLVNLGIGEHPISVDPFSLIENGRSLAGSRIGSIAETQEMLEFCAEHGIAAQVEVIGADEIDEAFQRLHDGDARYRFVIDVSTMGTVD